MGKGLMQVGESKHQFTWDQTDVKVAPFLAGACCGFLLITCLFGEMLPPYRKIQPSGGCWWALSLQRVKSSRGAEKGCQWRGNRSWGWSKVSAVGLGWALGAQQWQPPPRKVASHPFLPQERKAFKTWVPSHLLSSGCQGRASCLSAFTDLGIERLRGTWANIICGDADGTPLSLGTGSLAERLAGHVKNRFSPVSCVCFSPKGMGALLYMTILMFLFIFILVCGSGAWGEKLMSRN